MLLLDSVFLNVLYLLYVTDIFPSPYKITTFSDFHVPNPSFPLNPTYMGQGLC
jgi:hypothetical protein